MTGTHGDATRGGTSGETIIGMRMARPDGPEPPDGRNAICHLERLESSHGIHLVEFHTGRAWRDDPAWIADLARTIRSIMRELAEHSGMPDDPPDTGEPWLCAYDDAATALGDRCHLVIDHIPDSDTVDWLHDLSLPLRVLAGDALALADLADALDMTGDNLRHVDPGHHGPAPAGGDHCWIGFAMSEEDPGKTANMVAEARHIPEDDDVVRIETQSCAGWPASPGATPILVMLGRILEDLAATYDQPRGPVQLPPRAWLDLLGRGRSPWPLTTDHVLAFDLATGLVITTDRIDHPDMRRGIAMTLRELSGDIITQATGARHTTGKENT